MAVGQTQTDAELLECFANQHNEAAFEALVRRHGPMVLRLCQRVLHDTHNAEDAFQATFIVLARKAGKIARPESLANWLYGVAHRIALKARAGAQRRQARERGIAQDPPHAPADQAAWRDLAPPLQDELGHLPEPYRIVLALCYWEGKTVDEAAQQLGCTRGVVLGRLSRGRESLRSRLVGRGLALSSAALGTLLAQQAAAAGVPAGLLTSTVKAGTVAATASTQAGDPGRRSVP